MRISRVSAKIAPIVNSATALAFLPGTLTTLTLDFREASISILTGPPRETAMKRRFFSLSNISAEKGARWSTTISESAMNLTISSGSPMYSLRPAIPGFS